jgi:hypothetical protein
MYTISLKETRDEIIGVIGLSYWDSLTYMLHPESWNQGYCTEALRAFLSVLWEKQPERSYLNAAVMEENVRSERVLEKTGFKPWSGSMYSQQWSQTSETGEAASTSDSKDEADEEDDIKLDAFGKRKLSLVEHNELKTAIKGLNVQFTSPLAVEAPVGVAVSRPKMKTNLLPYRVLRPEVTSLA